MLATLLLSLVAVLSGVFATDAAAQPRGHVPSILTLPVGSSSLALGGAFPVAGASSDAVFVQPGVLDRARGIRLGFQRWGDGGTLVDLSGAREWWSGAVAVGIRALAHSVPAGATLPAPAERDLFDPDSVGIADLVATAGYGHSVGAVHLGGTVKWIARRTGGAETATAAADVGVALSFLEDARVGLAVQNLGPGLEREGVETDLPRQFRVDASVHEIRIGPLDAAAAAAVIRRPDGGIVPATGIELSWWPVQGRTFVGRIGIRRARGEGGQPLSLGAAFHGDSIVLDYAFRSFGERGATHRIGIGWR